MDLTTEIPTMITNDTSTTVAARLSDFQTRFFANLIPHTVSCIAAIPGNFLVIISVTKFEYLKSPAHFLVAMLACFDLALGLVGPFTQYALWTSYHGGLEMVNTELLYNIIICKAAYVLSIIFSAGDLLSIMFMTIDRFVYITYPLRYIQIITTKKLCFVIGVTLFYSAFSGALTYILVFENNPKACSNGELFEPNSAGYLHSTESLIVGIVLVIFYGKIAHIACKKITHPPGATTSQHSTAQLKITCVISWVIGVFVATNVYSIVAMSTVANINISKEESYTLLTSIDIVWRINTWANPFIYGYKNRDFRRAFRNLLRMKNKENEVEPYVQNSSDANRTPA